MLCSPIASESDRQSEDEKTEDAGEDLSDEEPAGEMTASA